MEQDKIKKELARQHKLAEEDRDNRRAMLLLQNNYSLYRVRADLEHFLWCGTMKWSDDGRHNNVPGWFFNAFIALIHKCGVQDTPEAIRRHPGQFNGVCIRLSRKELSRLCQKSCKTLSKGKMTRFLYKMEKAGVITRHRNFNRDNNTTVLYLRFNADRLMHIIDVVIPQAKKRAELGTPEVQNAGQEIEVKNVTKSPVPGAKVDVERLLMHEHSSSCTSNADEYGLNSHPVNEELMNDRSVHEERKDRPSARSVSSFVSEPGQDKQSVLHSPEVKFFSCVDEKSVTATPELLEMLGMLKHDFPADQFDSAAVKRIRNMMLPSRGANQLTASRMKRYQSLKADAWAGESEQVYKVLQVFLSCWSRVWAKCQQHITQDAFYRSAECLRPIDLQDELTSIVQAAQDIAQDMAISRKLWNKSELVSLVDYNEPTTAGTRLYIEIARFMIAKEDGPELEAIVRAKHKTTLRKELMNAPALFFVLKDQFPLAEWADLSDADIQTLIARESMSYGVAINRKMVGGFWGTEEEF
jgi:hypothetical protein